jgi:hypothetical protein
LCDAIGAVGADALLHTNPLTLPLELLLLLLCEGV